MEENILLQKIDINDFTFDKTIKNLRPLYYHLIDGYLNPKCGSTLKVIRYIIKNFAFIESNEYTNKITFLQITNNEFKFFNINNDEIIFTIDEILRNEKIVEFLNNLKYCIYQVVNDEHATSLVIEKINDYYKISCFNSGMGIDIHDSIFKNGIKYYKPNKIFKSKGIFDIKKLLIILLLPEYYNIIYDIIKYQENNKIIFIESDTHELGENKLLLGDIKLINQLIKFNQILSNLGYKHDVLNISFEYNKNSYDLNNLNDYKILNFNIDITNNLIYTNKKENREKFILYDNSSFNNEIIKYYKFMVDYLDKTHDKIDLKYEKFYNGKDNNYFDEINKNTTYQNINISIRNKLVFNYNEENDYIYIKDQESGSCTWFSIYWPILYFFIINDNYNLYNITINKIYETFYKIVKNIFRQDNFLETNYIELKKVFYDKFCKLGFFDEKLSYENIDHIYNIDYSLVVKNISINNTEGIKKNIEPNFLKSGKTLINYIMYNTNIEGIKDFELYFIFEKEISNSFFVKTKNTTDITEYNIDLQILINNFNETFDDDNLIYINMFISFALYINNIYKKYNFTDQTILINFCKFLYRYEILINILKTIFDLNEDITNKLILIDNCNRMYRILNIILINAQFNFKLIYEHFNEDFSRFKKLVQATYAVKYYMDKYLNLDFYLDNYIFKKTFFKKYIRNIDDYNKLLFFLYDNPKYIYQDFNYNEYTIDESYFILYNIYHIFENDLYRNKLIYFYADRFYDIYNNNKTLNKEMYWCLFNLQLLITKYINVKNNDEIIKQFYSIDLKFTISDTILEQSILELYDFLKIIDKIYINTNKVKNEFINYFIDNKDKLIDEFKIIISKYFKNYKINNEANIIEIEKGQYERISYDTDKLEKIKDYIFKNFDDLLFIENPFQTQEDILLLNINNKELLIINNKYYFKLIINISDKKISEYKFKSIKINKLYINNNKVLRYNEINLPFKYTIPLSCSHAIYENEIDDKYNIVYFINNIKTYILLGKCSIDGYHNVSINNNNLMYPDRESFKVYSEICKNFEINKLNIIYNDYNDKGFLFFNEKFYDLHNFEKKSFLINKLNDSNYEKTNLIPNNDLSKLQLKISKCNIINNIYIKQKIDLIIKEKNQIIFEFNSYVEDKNLNDLFSDYIHLYNYLNAIKIKNHLLILKNLLDDQYREENYIEFCSQLKIFNDQYQVKNNKFNYNFEALFELIIGFEIYEEQMKRYYSIINNYLDYDKNNCRQNTDITYNIENKKFYKEINILDDTNISFIQSGGNKCRKLNYKHILLEDKRLNDLESYISYPLHHLMMGKGKSAVITPLLSLYFSLIHNKDIIIVVPTHLENDTNIILNEFTYIFGIENLNIYSDDKIKEKFLEGKFNDECINCNTIMLIDEFDYLLDPLKSNFNITFNKKESIIDEFNLINPLPEMNLIDSINYIKNIKINSLISPIMKNDILKIIKQIKDKKLVENINWGIHPNRFYAIPYRSKGNPLLNSNFSSIILTIYLTLYYYIVLHEYKIDNFFIFKCIKEYNLYKEIFNEEEPLNLTIDYIKSKELDFKFIKNTLFKIVFKNIFERIKIANYQYNSSFVDIININNLYKIGYSGTININLPPIKSLYNFDQINNDEDEKINVTHAIENSKPFFYDETISPFFYEYPSLLGDMFEIDKYHAIIDTIGLFKNYDNIQIALNIFNIFRKQREIIFIDELNRKFVISGPNTDILSYNSNIHYKNPFIYYDQSHIIGVDIKQDKYPIMKGICIINNLSNYSEIAQAIFRLRKINMGHSIDLLYVDNKPIGEKLTSVQILELLLKNDNESKNGKKLNLLYQTLKSDIRKSRNKKEIDKLYLYNEKAADNILSKYDIRYFEKIKYYFKDAIETDFIRAFADIFFPNELEMIEIKFKKYFNDIKQNIEKLVYNIDNQQNSFELNYDQDQMNDKKIDNKKLRLVDNQLNINKPLFSDELYYEYVNYNPLLELFITRAIELLITYTIELDKQIRYFPNIFTQVTTFNFIRNRTGYLFVYIEERDIIIIIPGYMIIYFYKEYPVFNYKLILINTTIFKPIQEINKFKESYFFRLINDSETISYNPSEQKINYVCYQILLDREKIFEYQKKFLDKYTEKQYDIDKLLIIKDIHSYNTQIIQSIEKFIFNPITGKFNNKYIFYGNNDIFFKKYLNYKKKYIELKNNYI